MNKNLFWIGFLISLILLSSCKDNPSKIHIVSTNTEINPTPTDLSFDERMKLYFSYSYLESNEILDAHAKFIALWEYITNNPNDVADMEIYYLFEEYLNIMVEKQKKVVEFICPDEKIQSIEEKNYELLVTRRDKILKSLMELDIESMGKAEESYNKEAIVLDKELYEILELDYSYLLNK